ncbi:NepR family anti-sigma factor [Microvirga zambiensis]|uniref:NepR family anti-sigma factor n=1 Tax=Microvirga zambiensis TaxID=1402137 RepID=UPI0019203B36|nr:NepR family anti-sigma factor [Microvirga zambiensis]
MAVRVNDEQMKGLQFSDTASPSPDYTAKIVGHFLRKLYTEMLEEEFPERLQPLIEKLDAQEQANRHGVRR